MNDKKVFGSLRVVAGCSLVGAIVFGAFFSWVDVPGDVRSYGALLGAAAGVYAKVAHLL
ncbi:hypothetical protein N0K08_17370 [Acidovorax sp. Be4]|uniref:Lipoprotein n=1 Tax=Acidovorax bellezanensis TaxID=2976702 RepID=A0ABT2PRC4_9BURK|nr:hypothetical protein [Acidovorax sp. Be4]MCT9812416.1 hypothetical protein [Acidovorax sp. Be4]